MFEDKEERVENGAAETQGMAGQDDRETENVQAAGNIREAENVQAGQNAADRNEQAAQSTGTTQDAQSAGASQGDTTYRINFRNQEAGSGQQGQQTYQQAQQTYQQAQQGQQTQQQYRQQGSYQQGQTNYQQQGQTNYQQRGQQTQQQAYQQQGQAYQQYSYTTQGNQAGGSGSGGSGSGGSGSGGGRKDRRASRRDNTPRRRRPYLTAVVCSVICAAIIAGSIIGSSVVSRNMIQSAKQSVTVTTNQENLAAAAAREGAENAVEAETVASSGDEYSVAQIAEQCGSSVVAITNRGVSEVMTMFGYYEYESEGSGSGVIIGLNDDELLIVTNYHVVEDSDELTVCFFDSEEAVYSALVKGTDPNDDLAVVAIPVEDIDPEVLALISIATIGNSDDMKVGDSVVAIGNALGLGQSVTSGIISAVDREVTIDNYTARLIQTDAAINPGNSGGALFNMQGELIGINSAKYASEEIEGMGFAIPTSIAEPIIETLMSQLTRVKLDENYGCLNITGSDVTTEAYQAYGMPTGVYVNAVLEGGAAANAGIQTGDIITEMDGISLTGIEMLKDRLQYFAAGETVEFTVARNSGNGYEEFNVEVTLDNASEQDSSAFASSGEEEIGDDYGYSYGYGDGGTYGYGYGDGDTYGYGDIEEFFNEFGNSFGGGY